MASKIRVRIGEVEIEYEGEEAYLKDGLPELLQSVASLYANLTPPAPSAEPDSATSSGDSGETAIAKAEHQFQDSINTVAAKLGVKKGPDLILAALAHAELVQGKERASRSEISTEMKNATGFYKPSYASNFAITLKTLVKSGTINELTGGTYALSDSMKKVFTAKLAAKPTK